MSNLKVKTILVSQPEPKAENSPYFELQQKHKSKCHITKDGFLSVIGIYISLMTNNISTSSNSDYLNASTNWANIGLVLPTSITVKKNKIVLITSEIDIGTMEPNYIIMLEYENYKYQWYIKYSDLYVDPLGWRFVRHLIKGTDHIFGR